MTRDLHTEIVPVEEVPLDDKRLPGIDVLVVDDEQVIADTLTVILSRSGYSVLSAYDGRTALKIASENPPALLISDVVMPGMTGVELALSLRHSNPKCRILLFSGQATTADLLEKARALGHDFTILSKPVHPSDLIRRVTEYLRS
jgi:DNA-binding response OmpR family regulator